MRKGIKGDNHACFGNYGEQDGDATIRREGQQEETVKLIMDFIESNGY